MNIFEISSDLRQIIDELEENGGELTDNLQERLAITESSFKEKLQGYTEVIRSLDYDINAIDEERERLDKLASSKIKTQERLKSILIAAIEEFGDTDKKGKKFYNLPTCNISISQTKAVDVNTDAIKAIQSAINDKLTFLKSTNTVYTINNLDKNEIINMIKEHGATVCEDDLSNVDVTIATTLPIGEVTSEDSYKFISSALADNKTAKLTVSVSKTKLKEKLEENGACAPNLAKISINKHLKLK